MRSVLWFIMLFVIAGCGQESNAVEYEFLTPQILVLKNPKPYKYTSHAVKKSGLWEKENALLRDKNGNILAEKIGVNIMKKTMLILFSIRVVRGAYE